jgi:hypothetical protein
VTARSCREVRARPAAADDRLDRAADAARDDGPTLIVELLVQGRRQPAGRRPGRPLASSTRRAETSGAIRPRSSGPWRSSSACREGRAACQGNPDGAPPPPGDTGDHRRDASRVRGRGDRSRPARPRSDHARFDRGAGGRCSRPSIEAPLRPEGRVRRAARRRRSAVPACPDRVVGGARRAC